MTDITTLVRKMNMVQTCSACPEQYDVFLDGEQVGYLRLRHGYFSAEYPDCGGETVYEANPDGDGIFADYERDRFLTEALTAIAKRLTPHQREAEYQERHMDCYQYGTVPKQEKRSDG